MNIRKSTMEDIPAIMGIYQEAREYMKETGNPDQWGDRHPPQELIEKDIHEGKSYVCLDGNKNDEIVAVFYFNVEEEQDYGKIDGSWLNDKPYGVIHRIARGKYGKGRGAFCIEWCFSQYPNIRIDTHKDNKIMLELLKKLGYEYCGIIWLTTTGDERMAFQKCLK